MNFNEQVTGSVGTLPISGHPLLLSLVASSTIHYSTSTFRHDYVVVSLIVDLEHSEIGTLSKSVEVRWFSKLHNLYTGNVS